MCTHLCFLTCSPAASSYSLRLPAIKGAVFLVSGGYECLGAYSCRVPILVWVLTIYLVSVVLRAVGVIYVSRGLLNCIVCSVTAIFLN